MGLRVTYFGICIYMKCTSGCLAAGQSVALYTLLIVDRVEGNGRRSNLIITILLLSVVCTHHPETQLPKSGNKTRPYILL